MHWRKAHFIGIGGVGMSATAKLLKDAGVEVSGSDEAVYPPISTFLEKHGLDYQTPYRASNLPDDADLVVIGKNAKLVPEHNEEVAAALASGKEILSFPDVLARMSAGKENVVVAGSYGKSTSTALLAHVLESAKLEPSYFIGALPVEGANAKAGSGNLFVLEGDEYPSSNTDPRSKFLLLQPKHLLITPLAHDHFNVFPTPESYLKPFFELVKLAPQKIVVCTEGALSGELLQKLNTPITYGLHQGEYTAADIVWGETTSFSLMHNGQKIMTLRTALLGEHNIQNIVGVAAFVLSHDLMPPELLAEGVASFKGVQRRLDRKSEQTAIPIFEGFGSSYEKLASAIAAMKQHFPLRRLLVVFEPHTFSWRNKESLKWYDTAFAGAAGVYIFEPPQDGKEAQLSLDEMAAQVARSGIRTKGAHTPDELLAALEADLQQNDCILLSSSGAMGGLIKEVPALCERLFPR